MIRSDVVSLGSVASRGRKRLYFPGGFTAFRLSGQPFSPSTLHIRRVIRWTISFRKSTSTLCPFSRSKPSPFDIQWPVHRMRARGVDDDRGNKLGFPLSWCRVHWTARCATGRRFCDSPPDYCVHPSLGPWKNGSSTEMNASRALVPPFSCKQEEEGDNHCFPSLYLSFRTTPLVGFWSASEPPPG